MRVLKIEELSKTRNRVITDTEFAFVLYKGELRHYGIAEGAEISQETVREIREELLPKRAKLRAMNLLAKRQYTGKQLYDKLIQGGYDEETAESALAYVRSFHYVDDAEYASEFIRCNVDKRSRREIEQKLRQRGIAAEIIADAFDKMQEMGLYDEDIFLFEEENILGFQCKKFSYMTLVFPKHEYLHKKSVSVNKNIRSRINREKIVNQSKLTALKKYYGVGPLGMCVAGLFYKWCLLEIRMYELLKKH